MSDSFEAYVPPKRAKKENKKAKAGIKWLESQLESDIDFGEVTLTIHFHQGQVKTVDRSLRERDR